jgi:hypothetical protein
LSSPSEEHLHCLEWCPICRTADVLRETSSTEQWQSIQRDALVTMRALIDKYLESLDEGHAADPPPPEEISVEESPGRRVA